MYALYVTHPEVVIDPAVPTPRWGLSPRGRERASRFAGHPLARRLARIQSSGETKALELAEILAAGSGATVHIGENFGENDRSSTGYVAPQRFESLVDAFFGRPGRSVEGWETARDAQRRIVAAFEAALGANGTEQPIGFTGHGAVGTLLKCHLGGRAIGRNEDQRQIADPGGGNVFIVRLTDRALLTDWIPMESLPETIEGLVG